MSRPSMLLSGLASMVAVSCLLPCAVAGAQAPVVSFDGTYRAYSLWDAWRGPQDACTQTQRIQGREPAGPGRFPVLLYLHGTLADWGGNKEGARIAELAASRGFVAAALTYDSWVASIPDTIDGNARCMVAPGSGGDALAQICARPKADCSLGVAVAGFSAGGAIAGRAANFDARIRAAWLMGVNGSPAAPAAGVAVPAGTRRLPDTRLRIAIGRSDVEVRDPVTGQVSMDLRGLNQMTGQHCTSSPCLRANGSGYSVVQHSEVLDGVADHCWWMSDNRVVPSNGCTWDPPLEPGFRPPSSGPWSAIAGIDWLRSRLG